MSWEEFKKGHYSDDGKDEDSKEQMKEDEEKFKFADEDGDGKLDLEEYMAFYHPGVSNKFKRLGEAKFFFANFNLAKNYACKVFKNVTIFVSV